MAERIFDMCSKAVAAAKSFNPAQVFFAVFPDRRRDHELFRDLGWPPAPEPPARGLKLLQRDREGQACRVCSL